MVRDENDEDTSEQRNNVGENGVRAWTNKKGDRLLSQFPPGLRAVTQRGLRKDICRKVYVRVRDFSAQ